MNHFFRVSAILAFGLAASATSALEAQKVTDGVWALVGDLSQRSPENLGNNATFGVVVTDAGVVLVDPGGSWAGAKAIEAEIAGFTDKPVKYVINTGGQDHRWLGNGYWQSKGAVVIASNAAVDDQMSRGSLQLTILDQLIGAALDGTDVAYADQSFDDQFVLDFGGLTFQIEHPGPAHTPGDSYVWLESKSTMFTGDIVYTERMLGVGGQSSITDWPDAFLAMAAYEPAHVVPGHGRATTLAHARADTFDYLMNLRAKIGALIEDGGDIIAAAKVDQSAFSYLDNFEGLAGRNAQTAYEQMEWE